MARHGVARRGVTRGGPLLLEPDPFVDELVFVFVPGTRSLAEPETLRTSRTPLIALAAALASTLSRQRGAIWEIG